MFRPIASSHRRPHRRGTSFVLIVVVMLSVFAVVGTGYALLAIQQQKISLIRKDEQNGGLAAPDPTDTANAFFGALIYDTGDGTKDIFNGLRGHSIGRSMYGYDSGPNGSLNNSPFNGVGLFREDATGSPYAGYGLVGDRSQFVNYNLVMINNINNNNNDNKPMLLDPERMGTRGATANNPLPFPGQNNPNYVSKAAPYSYPDLKDFFAGVVDPNTGAVLLQSFHREWLFGPLDPLNGQPAATYDPKKSNWFNNQGRMKTLRPRPAEHPQFPRVPPNADGTYTGDVQNWPGGFTYALDPTSPANAPRYGFYGRNDSLWMDLGLPIITLPGNRKVQPMVAPLIVPIDGQLNASAHGNLYGNSGATHISYAGYGAWEVNLAAALTNADATKVVKARGNSPPNPTPNPIQQRNTKSSQAYAPSYAAPLPSYAPVPWTASAAPSASLTYPTSNSMTGLPTFTGFDTSNVAMGNHPSLFNPTEWPGDGSATLRTFPLTNIKRLSRFGYTPNWYAQADVASAPPAAGLLGDQTNYPFYFATGQTTPANYNYRLDPAHSTRGVITTRGYSLDRPMVSPTFMTGALSLAGLAGAKPVNPSANAPYPGPGGNLGPGSDFGGPTRWFNIQAALGSVNLNRPLADYRDLTKVPNIDPMTGNSTPQPLSPTNLANFALADSDRQQLARDIFVRMAVATGGALTTNPTLLAYPAYSYTIVAPPSAPGAPNPQYEALRYLAQLAANIVDYIDNDDISTAFAWDPKVPTELVFGVEKPRLVINEAYSEFVNDAAEPRGKGKGQGGPMKDGHVRFWVELLNPTSTTTGVFGDGTVQLRYQGNFSPYQLVIARAARTKGAVTTEGVSYLTDPTNVRGDLKPGYAPDIVYTFSNPDIDTDANKQRVAPNNGTPDAAGLPTNGIALVGPKVSGANNNQEFDPQNNGMAMAPWTRMIEAPAANGNANGQDAMEYLVPPADLNTVNLNNPNSDYRRHIILLRRLANPYDKASPTNPYVTVDTMDYVPSNDALFTGVGGGGGGTAINKRFSVGKVQPYAALSMPDNAAGAMGVPSYTFPTSMVLVQNPSGGPGANDPQHTFGRHNYTGGGMGPSGTPSGSTFVAGPSLKDPDSMKAETLMTPFDWLVHMDRPLVNQIELFQVRDTPPHRVTNQFLFPGGNNGVDYERGFANWTSTAGLTRALEYLSVKPWTVGVPHGGRVAGKIALNAVQNQRVITGLFDPQSGNGFDPSYVTNTAWGQWIGGRSTMQPRTLADGVTQFTGPVPLSQPNPVMGASPPFVPAPSQTDDPSGIDRPFYSLGAPAAAPGGFAYAAGGSQELTILRQGGGKPMLFANAGSNPAMQYPASQPQGPSYTQAEPLRKIFNNTTPVSHTYLVYLTVGYFDVVNANPNPPAGWPSGVPARPLLGAEAYLAVPGDIRAKFVAVIDMSNMTTNLAPTPYFTSLENTVYPPLDKNGKIDPTIPVTLNIAYSSFNATSSQLYVASDGQEVLVGPGSALLLGYGAEQQQVTVQQIQGPGQVVVTGLGRTAWGGSCVSNAQPGYPGPQPGFAYTSASYKAVLPYVERLR